jgi:hypothetical protein
MGWGKVIISALKLLFISFLYLSLHSATFADAERIVDFQYDAAGNLIDISSEIQDEPPNITSLLPNLINIGLTIGFVATGTDLLEAQVTTNDPGLIVSNVSTTRTQVMFSLTATNSASVGAASITFTTFLGSDSEVINVGERLPEISTIPNPIVILPDGQSNQIQLIFEQAKTTDQTYNIAISNSAIASVAESSVTLLAGETNAVVNLTGLTLGNAALEISVPSQLINVRLPVYVADAFSGDGQVNASAVGVIVDSDDPSLPSVARKLIANVGVKVGDDNVRSPSVGLLVGSDSLISKPVGVLRGSDVFLAHPVGVLAGTDAFLSAPVGLLVGNENPITSPFAGTIVGPLLLSSQPLTTSPGAGFDLIISGANLQDVDAVTILPADDIILGAFTINPEGTEVTIPINIEITAATGIREINVNAISGPVEPRDVPVLTLTIE